MEDRTALVLVKVKPEQDPRVLALAKEAEGMLAYAQKRTITTDLDLKPATDDLSLMSSLKKALTEAKAEYIKPIRGHLDDVNATFASIFAPLEEADKLTRSKLLAYRQAQAARQAEAEAINRLKEETARREAQFSGTGEVTVDTQPVQAEAPVQRVSTDMGTAAVVRNRTWELAHFASVPDEFKLLDSGKITRVVKAGGSIPGIHIIEGETLRVTARKG